MPVPPASAAGAAERDLARASHALTRALLICCAAALVLGGVATGVGALVAGPDDAALAPLLTFVALGQATAVGAAGVAVVPLCRLRRAGARVDAAGAEAGGGAAARLTRTVVRTFRLLSRALLASGVVLAALWVLLEPAALAGALTGSLLSAQVAAALHVTARWVEGRRRMSAVAPREAQGSLPTSG